MGIAYKWNTEKVKKIIAEMHGDEYELIGDYTVEKEPICILHKTCGQTYHTRWSIFSQGRKHICYRFVDDDIFKKRVEQDGKGEYEFLDPYINAKTKIRCHHKKCGNIWEIKPNHFLHSGNRCPKCTVKIPLGESKIIEYFDKHGIEYVHQFVHSDLPSLSFDFCINDSNGIILIEFDGQQHIKPKFNMTQEEFEKQVANDQIKNAFCVKNNIPLLRIQYKGRNKIPEILEYYENYGSVPNDYLEREYAISY